MTLRAFLFCVCYLMFNLVFGQKPDSVTTDSTRVLAEVTVQAYEYEKPIIEVPAAVGVINNADMDRFNNSSLLPVINTIPGVRMEERSPGSYRISIRGSSLRSPFGVRNVKIYWNDLPFTDPGGNTYLNLIDLGSLKQTEVIKGPGSSLYGAGTGGVLLFKSADTKFNKTETYLSGMAGSYGLFRATAGVQNHTAKSNSQIHYSHQQADGYREQSAMRRDVLQTQGSYSIDEKRTITANFFYADMQYETPGGLTLAQYEKERRQARPRAGQNAGAVEQKAAVYNKTIYAGVSQAYDFNTRWSNRTGAYLTFTQFENPAIRNYERRNEQSFGTRSTTHYRGENLSLTFGGEFQQGFSPIKTYGNNKGAIDTLQNDTEISSATGLIFSQAEFNLPRQFFITVGGSLNFYHVDFTDLTIAPVFKEERKFAPVLSPRIALLKKINNTMSIYGSFSQGFSPPTNAELYPSAAVFDKKLKPEKGNNYEAGFRMHLNRSVFVNVVAYKFLLNNAITTRRNDDGGEYFVNVGKTVQKGLEINLSFNPTLKANGFVSDFKLWTSITVNRYNFSNYVKDTVSKAGLIGHADYSNNKLTGTPPNVITAGCDVLLRSKLYCNITCNYTDKIPLDDANTAFANSYFLLGARVGWRPTFGKLSLDFFGGVDNLLNQEYSLGNDLNALSGRFYNAAPMRNFFIGLKTSINRSTK